MENKDLINRFYELYERASVTGRPVYTDFLDLSSSDVLSGLSLYPEPETYGGYEGAERVMACFGEPDRYPFKCLCVSPKDMKFADKFTHRDILGAILNLGIKRQTTGDIIIRENRAYVFVCDTVCDLIINELHRVKRTAVVCAVSELPDGAAAVTEDKKATVSSLRADCVVSAVFGLSRSGAKDMFLSGLIFIRGKECGDPSYELKENDVVSVRGRGKFRYCGQDGVTGKGRLRISCKLYK